MNRYVTVAMLCQHAGRSRSAVVRALKRSGVTVEHMPGVKGGRILERDANRFLALQWPDAGSLQTQQK